MDKGKKDILLWFHHIHHKNGRHFVHHCGGAHHKIDQEVAYEVEHCNCQKHRINKKQAVGHDEDMNERLVLFNEECPEGGWHIESGEIR